jgi:hypothetical protein
MRSEASQALSISATVKVIGRLTYSGKWRVGDLIQ